MDLDLKSDDIIFLDTAPVIFFFEEHPNFYPALKTLFDNLYETGAQAITSIITYIELTTHPARQGKSQLVRKYRDYLTNSDNISLFPLDIDIADYVVEMRAKYQFKTPDAIHLAAAVAYGCDLFLTNDHRLAGCTEIPVEIVAP